MFRTLVGNWWLLIACGILDAAIATIYLAMAGTNGPVLSHTWIGTVMLTGKLTMAAGACTIFAALWNTAHARNWLLGLNGAALVGLGFVQYALTRFPIGILAVALLVTVAAVAIGIVQAGVARASWREHRPGDAWLFGVAGTASGAFVLLSLAFGLRLIPLGRGSHLDLVWLGAYFGFAALCTVALAMRATRSPAAQ